MLFRVEKNKNYTVLSNHHFRDKNLSLKAKGLLSLMLSLPDDWDYSINGLVKLSSDGEASVRTALSELEKNKYLFRKRIYKDGKIVDWEYIIYENPLQQENLDVENQQVENQGQLNTKEQNTKEEKVSKDTSPKKKNLYEQCLDIIDAEFKDEDIKEALRVFLSVRIRIGRMSAQSFRGIILELYQLSKDKKEALDIIRQATDRGYMKFYPVQKYRKNTYKDNIVQPVKEKTEEEKKWEEYQKYLDTVDLFDKPKTFEEWLN